jgi:hypothetical protein
MFGCHGVFHLAQRFLPAGGHVGRRCNMESPAHAQPIADLFPDEDGRLWNVRGRPRTLLPALLDCRTDFRFSFLFCLDLVSPYLPLGLVPILN